MTDCSIYENVNYCKKDDFYIIGINETSGSGISSTTFEGEITIPAKYNGKEILEICSNSFQNCLIKKVTIYARLNSINQYAFMNCNKLTYMNIPSSVTFIGYAAISLASGEIITVNVVATIEFDKGRTKNLYIGGHNFAKRIAYYIIYPSNIKPTYDGTHAYYLTTTLYVFAYSSFDFYTKMSFPISLVKSLINRGCTCNVHRKMCYFNPLNTFILLLVLQ